MEELGDRDWEAVAQRLREKRQQGQRRQGGDYDDAAATAADDGGEQEGEAMDKGVRSAKLCRIRMRKLVPRLQQGESVKLGKWTEEEVWTLMKPLS